MAGQRRILAPPTLPKREAESRQPMARLGFCPSSLDEAAELIGLDKICRQRV